MKFVLAILLCVAALLPGYSVAQSDDAYQVVLQVLPAYSPAGEGMTIMVTIRTDLETAYAPFSLSIPNRVSVIDGSCFDLCKNAEIYDYGTGSVINAALSKEHSRYDQAAELRVSAYVSPMIPSGSAFTFTASVFDYTATVTYVTGSGQSAIGLSNASTTSAATSSLLTLPDSLNLTVGADAKIQTRITLDQAGTLVIYIPHGLIALDTSGCVDRLTLQPLYSQACEYGLEKKTDRHANLRLNLDPGEYTFMINLHNETHAKSGIVYYVLTLIDGTAVHDSVRVVGSE